MFRNLKVCQEYVLYKKKKQNNSFVEHESKSKLETPFSCKKFC